MSSTDEATLFDTLASPFMPNLLLNTPPSIVNCLVPPLVVTGRIREYAPVGDGMHSQQQQQQLQQPQEQPLPMLPLMDSVRQRPQTLVRKVSVVGSHVLRYVGRHSNLCARRHQMRNLHRLRMSCIDPPPSYESASNNDRVDNAGWLRQHVGPTAASSELLQLRPESYAIRLMLTSGIHDCSFLSLFNWKIYVGMLCIIAVQALLKLAYKELFSVS